MNNSSSCAGTGFIGLLTLIFITLKLCGVISWSWLWVLSPLWITATIVLCILVVLGVLFAQFFNDLVKTFFGTSYK